MQKLLGCVIFSFALLFSLNSYAETHYLVPGMSVTYDFRPGVPQEFKNPLFWSVSVTCKVKTPDESDEIVVTGLNNHMDVNGVSIDENDVKSIEVSPGSVLDIKAKGRAKASLVNRGKSTVTAACTI